MANIKDVAKLAGVSVTTVSRVLNNKGYISQDTYESVYRAIDQLDYVPNQIARNLFKQKSYYISLIVPDSSHPFWAEITKYMKGSFINIIINFFFVIREIRKIKKEII